MFEQVGEVADVIAENSGAYVGAVGRSGGKVVRYTGGAVATIAKRTGRIAGRVSADIMSSLQRFASPVTIEPLLLEPMLLCVFACTEWFIFGPINHRSALAGLSRAYTYAGDSSCDSLRLLLVLPSNA